MATSVRPLMATRSQSSRWVSHQARIFRHRRNAEILLEKLLRDDRGYSPIVYVRLEELRVRGEWKTVRFAEGGEEE